ncbi:MAG: hypothetical protein K8R54_11570 [Bacteroidales bacterium]|nr:hypothetical protein [Bacteroidales bacterium]
MKIRKIIYEINFVHILNFKEEYQKIVMPYFDFTDKVQYVILNEKTIHEGMRLIFPNEGCQIDMTMKFISFTFEGDISELKKSNKMSQLFFDIYEKISKLEGFHRTTSHKFISYAVNIDNNENDIKPDHYFKINPFNNIFDFACIYNYNDDKYKCKYTCGPFEKKDILKFNLNQFETDNNKDLFDNAGFLHEIVVVEDVSNVSFKKFKELLKYNENTFKKYSESK